MSPELVVICVWFANIAASMGHSVEVHLDNYSRFAPDGTVDIYAKANQLV